MAWERITELYIGNDPASATALVVSGLDIDFNVKRSVVFVDNTAEFTIYNAAESTRNLVLQEGANVIFKAGHKDSGTGTIFIGCITHAASARAGGDWVTNIRASALRGAAKPLDASFITLSYSAGTTIDTLLTDVGIALGLVLMGKENAAIPMPNGFSFAGRVRDALAWASSVLKSRSIGLYIDNGELVVYMAGKASGLFSEAYLTYDSGLLSVKDTTEEKDVGFVAMARSKGAIVAGEQPQTPPEPAKTPEARAKQTAKAQAERAEHPPAARIAFESLLIPKLQPNSVIKVETDLISGSYIVDTLEFSGNNYGGDFKVSGEAFAPL